MDYAKLKRHATVVLLIGAAIVATYATMTIQDLRADVAGYEDRLNELKVQKVTLEAVQDQLSEENKALENHPLR